MSTNRQKGKKRTMKTTNYLTGSLISTIIGAIAITALDVITGGHPSLEVLGIGAGLGLVVGLITLAIFLPKERRTLKNEIFFVAEETLAESIVKTKHQIDIRMGIKTPKGDWKILLMNTNMKRMEFFRTWNGELFTSAIEKGAVNLIYNEEGKIIVKE